MMKLKNICCVGLLFIGNFVFSQSYTVETTISDTVCTGQEYHKYDFHLPAKDSIGLYLFPRHLKTSSGNDSVVTLSLFVFETPVVTIEASANVVCGGEEVVLEALVEGGSSYVLPEVAIGDIVCTDGTIVKPSLYRESGKSAKGIVFWVNNSGKHGWALGLRELNSAWGTGYFVEGDVSFLNPFELYTRLDTTGYENTRKLRESFYSGSYLAANAVDFSNGWYLPSIGQLYLLDGVMPEVNESLVVAGQLLISMEKKYWSSTVTHGSSNYSPFFWGDNWCSVEPFRNINTIREICAF